MELLERATKLTATRLRTNPKKLDALVQVPASASQFVNPQREVCFANPSISFAEIAIQLTQDDCNFFSNFSDQLFSNSCAFINTVCRIEERWGTAAALAFGAMMIGGEKDRETVIAYAGKLDNYERYFNRYYSYHSSVMEFILNVENAPGVRSGPHNITNLEWISARNHLCPILERLAQYSSQETPELIPEIGACIGLTLLDNIIFLKKEWPVGVCFDENYHSETVLSPGGFKMRFPNVNLDSIILKTPNQIFSAFGIFSILAGRDGQLFSRPKFQSEHSLAMFSLAVELNPSSTLIQTLLEDEFNKKIE